MKYRNEMTPNETAQLLAECDALAAAYAAAAAHDALHCQPAPEGWEDETSLLHKAALNRGRP